MADFDEEEVVWSYENEDSTHSSPTPRKHRECSSSSSPAWRLPRASSNKAQQSSAAPVSIPDWSKIYGKHHAHKHEPPRKGSSSSSSSSWGDDHEMVSLPPHEWLARKLARTQVSSFSVCEGVGRTLKGRDLSKLRNAVLTKTGFLE
ncbi:hypothetical protein like AT4G04630 [Hibiscus trionum]|uniref:Senescence regulator n=1 Tax=Hibiscus trionum TaxID=183268 RepID=A0A9W7M9L6_HIBTR|nr:hypothetical protein like AT4G04630 [Hibiscus trionum]